MGISTLGTVTNDEPVIAVWIAGNEYVHLLTSAAPTRRYTLRIDLGDSDEETRFAEYTNFTIASDSDYYRLDFGAYTGNAGLFLLFI